MKILMINVVCGIRSTGRICTDLACELEKLGHEVKIAYGRENVPSEYERFSVPIGSKTDVLMHGLKARALDQMGMGSTSATKRFIKWVQEYNPDIIHLHNIHGYYINVPILFEYLKTCNKTVIWTLHDCWSFTGHCTYFNYENCNKWEKGCKKCPQKDVYPVRWFIDNSKNNYQLKKSLFSDIPNMQLVTPSIWLQQLVEQSYLGNYPITTIHNGINTDIFKPTESDISNELGINGKKIILGVASVWDRRKGLQDFIELSNLIDDNYAIVLVGLSDNQIAKLPDGIIGISKTDSAHELAKLYSAAYVYVNPTYEDNYPTTNLEAICCGSPVITYDTGGSPESANLYGITTSEKSASAIYKSLGDIANIELKQLDFSNSNAISQYMTLYKKIL